MKRFPILSFGLSVLLILLLQTNRGAAQTPAGIVPLTPMLENYSYPFPVRYLSLSIQQQELKMAYMDVKPEKPNGRTIVLLHGKNFGGSYWAQTIRSLSAKGFRVVVPDQIGFGKSSKPDHLQYSFQMLATNTRILLDSLGIDKADVLGHSMGGMLATRFTLMFPERVGKLVLEDPIGLEDWKTKVPWQSVDNWYRNELKQNYASLKKYQVESYFHNHWLPAYDTLLSIPAGWTLSPDYARVAWNSALTYDMIFTQPVCYEFQNLRRPVLLIIGQADRTALGKNLVADSIRETLGNYPVLGRLTSEKIPECRLVELEGIGHIPHVEVFEIFFRALTGFLSDDFN